MFVIAAPLPGKQTTSVLPNPEFGNQESATVELLGPKRSINGTTRTYVKTKGGRRRLQWTFHLTRNKNLELVEFLRSYLSTRVEIVDHQDKKWQGVITNNPVESTIVRAGKPARTPWPEGSLVETVIEFEGLMVGTGGGIGDGGSGGTGGETEGDVYELARGHEISLYDSAVIGIARDVEDTLGLGDQAEALVVKITDASDLIEFIEAAIGINAPTLPPPAAYTCWEPTGFQDAEGNFPDDGENIAQIDDTTGQYPFTQDDPLAQPRYRASDQYAEFSGSVTEPSISFEFNVSDQISFIEAAIGINAPTLPPPAATACWNPEGQRDAGGLPPSDGENIAEIQDTTTQYTFTQTEPLAQPKHRASDQYADFDSD